jgi:hypothetical protein
MKAREFAMQSWWIIQDRGLTGKASGSISRVPALGLMVTYAIITEILSTICFSFIKCCQIYIAYRSDVLLTAPAKGDVSDIVAGVNFDVIRPDEHIYAAASCTTNAIAPIIKVVGPFYL